MKDVLEAEGLPEAEYLLVAEQYVAAGFEVVALFDAGAGDRLAELHRMALMDKGDVVDDEDPGFTNAAQILDDPLRADQPIAAPVKGPGAAERAIPRAAAGEFDRGARIKDADKILAPMAQQVARRHDFVERMDEARRRPFAGGGDRAGDRGRVIPGFDRRQQQRHRRFAFPLEHAVDGARAVLDQRLCDERCAVPTDADEDAGKARLGRLGEIDDLGDVRQIVATKGDDVRLPALDRAEIGALVFDLEVEQPNRMAGLPRRGGDQFEADRFEPQKNLRIGQRAGMDAEQPHRDPPPLAGRESGTSARPAHLEAYCEAELPAVLRVPRNMTNRC